MNLTPRPNSLNLEDGKIQAKSNEQQQQPKLLSDEAILNEQVNYTTGQHYASQIPESAMTTNFDRSNIDTDKTIETPVSAKKFYPQSEHLKPIAEDNNAERNTEFVNQMLNNKTFSYYDNIIKTDKDEKNFQEEQASDPDLLDVSYTNGNVQNNTVNNCMQSAAISQKFRYLVII